MKLTPPLEKTRLTKRYKRFLADVIHPELGEMTVHCPNTGSMKNCWGEGWTAWIQDSGNPKRKYRYSWVVSESPEGERIGINTHLANQLVAEAIENGMIQSLQGYDQLRTEVKYGAENSRIDILLEQGEQKTFIEVKNVTLKEADGVGYFPDAKTERGQKHLRELMEMVKKGQRAVLFFVVQHTGINTVRAAAHIDVKYAELLTEAIAIGVEVMAWGCDIQPDAISITHPIEFENS